VCTASIDVKRLISAYRDSGLLLGSSFTVIQDVRASSDGSHVVAKLACPSEYLKQGHLLPPPLLDALFQLSGGVVQSIDRVWIQPDVRTVGLWDAEWCYGFLAVHSNDSTSVIFDCSILTSNGVPVARCEGVHVVKNVVDWGGWKVSGVGSTVATKKVAKKSKGARSKEDLEKVIKAMVLYLTGEKDVALDASLADVGMDSLGATELTSRLGKELNIRLQPTVVMDYPTISALAGYLSDVLDSNAPTAAVSEVGSGSTVDSGHGVEAEVTDQYKEEKREADKDAEVAVLNERLPAEANLLDLDAMDFYGSEGAANVFRNLFLGDNRYELFKVFVPEPSNEASIITYFGDRFSGHPSVVHGGITSVSFIEGATILLRKLRLDGKISWPTNAELALDDFTLNYRYTCLIPL